jgi:hypothetical protein
MWRNNGPRPHAGIKPRQYNHSTQLEGEPFMKERPILFKGPMVTGVLSGIKDRTRRLTGLENINKDPNAWQFVQMFTDEDDGCFYAGFKLKDSRDTWMKVKSQCGTVGDILWVRENWAYLDDEGVFIQYQADGEPLKTTRDNHWRPSIHMFRYMSRITLQITNITVERLQDITEEDAEKEGVDFLRHIPDADETLSAKQLFEILWESINGPDSWDSNPYVFVIEFERIK